MITKGYKGLQGATRGYKGLQKVTRGYNRLQGVTGGYKRLHGVTRSYRRLQRVTRGYRGLLSRDALSSACARGTMGARVSIFSIIAILIGIPRGSHCGGERP